MIENKKYHQQMANGFVGEGSCYIHTEMKNGKNPETVLAGDMMAIAWGVSAEIVRLSQISKMPAKVTIDLISDMIHATESGEIPNVKRTVNKKRPMMVVDGQDWQEEWIADKEKQYAKKYKKLEMQVLDYKHQVEEAEQIVKNVKKNFDAERTKLRSDKERLQAIIDKLTHRLEEMEDVNTFRGVTHD